MSQPTHDLPAIALALQNAFPALPDITPLKLLGEGFSSLVVETPQGTVFRIPRTPEAGARYAREFQMLPLLRPHLAVAIPEPSWHLPPCSTFPWGVIGYPKLPGRPLDFEDLLDPVRQPGYTEQIATILAALHRVPTHRVPLPDDWPIQYQSWQNQYAAVMPVLKEKLLPGEYRRVAAWWQQFLGDHRLRGYSPVVVHGDFWFGNLLVEGDQITGLLDFENLALGDPAADFTPLLYLGESFFRQVLDAYQQQGGRALDSGFEHRLRQLWSVREFGGLEFAIRYNDAVELEDALMKLRKGPILSPAGLNGWG